MSLASGAGRRAPAREPVGESEGRSPSERISHAAAAGTTGRRTSLRPGAQLSARVHPARRRARGAARHHRPDGEARRHEDGRAGALSRHRRSHLARGRVLPRRDEARRAAGHLRHQQPVLVDGRRQVLQLLGDGQARRRHSANRAAAAEGLPGRHRSHGRVAAQPGLSDRLGRTARLRRPPGDPQALLRRRLEARLQGRGQARAARGLRSHGAVLHDAAAVHQLRSLRPLLHVRQDRHHAGGLRSARAPVSRRARVPVGGGRRRAWSATRSSSTWRSATR